MSSAAQTLSDQGPPSGMTGPVAWARANLFNSWTNSILTVIALYIIVRVGWSLIGWGIVNAEWTGNAAACHKAAGACWAVIHEKFRLMLFGTYPYAQQWRPALAIVLFLAMIPPSCVRQIWNRWLLVAWAIVLFVMGWLMFGGLGLPTVQTSNFGGLPLTLMLSIVGILFAFPLAMVLALGRRSRLPVVRSFCIGYIEFFRGVPLISLLFLASAMFPLFMPVGVTIDGLLRAQIAVILFAAAYMAEVIRAGLQALPKGQYEAAEALGLSYPKRTVLIVLPQALKIVIPPLVNNFIGTFKNTSLVVIIGLFDLLGTIKLATQDPVWRSFSFEGYIFAAVLFFVFCFFMSKFSQYLEKLLSRSKTR
ncbi:MAG TPA: amino acid ABC transporter permease [Candidatus Cybelea sp.]|nr:amino acid ABC transporter permease [Candidatus Cybelea sp.]